MSKGKSPFFKPTNVWKTAWKIASSDPGGARMATCFMDLFLIISREKGAGGNAVAQCVGKRLGWQVFDNEIVDEIAKKAHVRRQLIESLDERDQATIQAIIGQLLNPQEIGTAGYLVHLKQIVLALRPPRGRGHRRPRSRVHFARSIRIECADGCAD